MYLLFITLSSSVVLTILRIVKTKRKKNLLSLMRYNSFEKTIVPRYHRQPKEFHHRYLWLNQVPYQRNLELYRYKV